MNDLEDWYEQEEREDRQRTARRLAIAFALFAAVIVCVFLSQL